MTSTVNNLVSFINDAPEMANFKQTVKRESKNLLTSFEDFTDALLRDPKFIVWALTGKTAYTDSTVEAFGTLMSAVREHVIYEQLENVFYITAEVNYRSEFNDKNVADSFSRKTLGVPFIGVGDPSNLTILDVGFIGKRPGLRVYDQNIMNKEIGKRVRDIKDVSFGSVQAKGWGFEKMNYRFFVNSLKGNNLPISEDFVRPPIHF